MKHDVGYVVIKIALCYDEYAKCTQ